MNDTTLQLTLPSSTYEALRQAAAQRRTTEAELAVKVLQDYFVERLKQTEPLFGLFADEPELVDELIEDILRRREVTPLRLRENNDESEPS